MALVAVDQSLLQLRPLLPTNLSHTFADAADFFGADIRSALRRPVESRIEPLAK